jgi:hypothetical protein
VRVLLENDEGSRVLAALDVEVLGVLLGRR